ncbi:hypothetical protein C8J36_11235 [Rhizobium sp. PP-F2F-G48]|uniref:glycosyltransferase family 2 protein n=1 Tax=Rhizobium sp. PP-F2F-G48 TaxID=2135651 RepID=UPI00104F38D6|nr:glycosyltransferase family 2 protein [Rhizobium sp. PP-F2F-G48]TCM49668.1 hypothetical protein C8J36_11235 [Rhizobium sp. PP-F2F-G48]
MQVEPTLAVVIVNFRTADLAIDCLASLAVPGTVPEKTRIVIVDAVSGDGSAEKIAAAIAERGWAGNVDFRALDVNGGFSYGNNRAIDHALEAGRPDYVLLLNPDTVARPGSIRSLVSFMERHPAAGIAGSRLEDPDGTPQACAFRFPSLAADFESEVRFGPVTRLLRRWQVAPPMPDTPARIDWVSGASMLVRYDVFEEIGGLDEDYFLYYEEVDFCRRAAKAGWECWHVPASRVVHLVGQATGVTLRDRRPARRPSYWFNSRRRYYLKHHGAAYRLMADTAWVVGHVLCRMRMFLEGKRSGGPPKLLGDFIRHASPVTTIDGGKPRR